MMPRLWLASNCFIFQHNVITLSPSYRTVRRKPTRPVNSWCTASFQLERYVQFVTFFPHVVGEHIHKSYTDRENGLLANRQV